MFFYSTNANDKAVKKSLKFLQGESSNCNLIIIIGATGWATFGDKGSPMYSPICSCQEARIILIYPLSPAVDDRAKDLVMSTSDYRGEIYKSIEYLKSLRKTHHHVELKMYNHYPSWKYILVDKYIWVQRYPADKHVHLSPSYALEKAIAKEGPTLYDQLYQHCLEEWNSKDLGLYDFDTGEIEFIDTSGNRSRKRIK